MPSITYGNVSDFSYGREIFQVINVEITVTLMRNEIKYESKFSKQEPVIHSKACFTDVKIRAVLCQAQSYFHIAFSNGRRKVKYYPVTSDTLFVPS